MPYNIRLSEAEMRADDFDAARSFVVVEEETQRWSKWVASKKWAQKTYTFTLVNISRTFVSLTANGHIATVDALRLFAHRASNSRFCLSGGRDRAIKLWNISDLQVPMLYFDIVVCNHFRTTKQFVLLFQTCQSTSPAKPCVDMQNAHEVR